MPSPDALGVFVKAPVAGRVKTRLAADIGPLRATALYRRLGRQVVGATAGGDYETAVWYAPRGREALIRSWLSGLGVPQFHAQPGGDLGSRLRAAFGRHLREGARRVVVIGSDCPGVNRQLIGEAFAALEAHDLVVGPAWDGGYYLIGMKTLHEPLFRGIRWSSPEVLSETASVARGLGLSCHSLLPLRDVDTMSDAQALGLVPPHGTDMLRSPCARDA